MANSYKLPHDPSVLNWSGVDDNIYTRNGGSNQKYLEKRIASLENAEDCIVLSSGVAALSGLFFFSFRNWRSCDIFKCYIYRSLQAFK